MVGALWHGAGTTRTALVAHAYGVSVAQERLSRDPARVSSMTWLNGGLFPDLGTGLRVSSRRPFPVPDHRWDVRKADDRW